MQKQIKEQSFKWLQEQVSNGGEGIVLLGCGGDVSEWTDGVTKILQEQDIIPDDYEWDELAVLKTTGGRTDIVMLFSRHQFINVGKLATWRLPFGDCSWASDFVVNYKGQYGVVDGIDDTDYQDNDIDEYSYDDRA